MTTKTITDQLIAESEAVMNAAAKMDVEEMMRNATDQAEPGDATGSVVHRPDSDTPFGMTLSDIASAGWVRVWDVRTREVSLVTRNLLRSQLGKRDDRGKPIFTTVEPELGPARGHLKCPLHASSSDRKNMDRFGFVACPKANLRTPLDVRTHMQHRHKREYEAIEEDKRNAIEAEERQVRQILIGRSQPSMPAVQEVATASSSSGEAVTFTEQSVDETVTAQVFTKRCPKCQEIFSSPTSRQSVNEKVRRHKKTCK